ncbi:hypothetical protein LINGRAHAP2_LOCUS12118 [Linum grandiflorum]
MGLMSAMFGSCFLLPSKVIDDFVVDDRKSSLPATKTMAKSSSTSKRLVYGDRDQVVSPAKDEARPTGLKVKDEARPTGLKVKSYVSDEYKHRVELAALD